jgi:hypothetical protein
MRKKQKQGILKATQSFIHAAVNFMRHKNNLIDFDKAIILSIRFFCKTLFFVTQKLLEIIRTDKLHSDFILMEPEWF